MKNMKNNKGITLVVLVITIIVLTIITGVAINGMSTSNEASRYNKMNADIKLLKDKILVYYNKYNEIPITERNIQINNIQYNEIDLSKLDSITLNYGKDYGQDDNLMVDESDVYVINDDMNIYYLKGVKMDGQKEHYLENDAATNKSESRLPQGYTELEYIESTGTQYIDTGIISSSNVKITIDYMILGYSNTGGTRASCVMRVSNSAGRVNIIPIITNSGNQMQFGWGNTYQNFSFTTNINQKYHAEIDNGVLTIDGTQVGSIPSTFSTQSNIEIFRLKADERVREYGCKMWDNDVLIRDLVPCLDSEGEACMYDTVSGTPFYSETEDDFVAGPEV